MARKYKKKSFKERKKEIDDLTDRFSEKIDEYFFTSRSDTIRYLIASGLKHHEITSKLLKQRKVDIQKYLDV